MKAKPNHEAKMKLYQHSFNSTEQFIAIMDNNMSIKMINKALLKLLKLTKEEIYDTPYWELPIWAHDFELQNKLMFAFEHIYMGEEVKFEADYYSQQGDLRYIEFTIKPVFEDGEIEMLIAMGYDVTEAKRTESKLYRVEKELTFFFETGVDGYFIRSLPSGIALEDSNQEALFDQVYARERISKYNQSLQQILEISCQDNDGDRFFNNEKIRIERQQLQDSWTTMVKTGHVRFETSFLTSQGLKRYVEFTLAAIIEAKSYMGCFGSVKDITENKNHEKHLFQLANYDGLTGVSNRRYFIYCVNKRLAEQSDGGATMVMFDIDHFKAVNDNYGHDIGDVALKAVSNAINQRIGQQGLFARMGGEEFCAFVWLDLERAQQLVESILEDIRRLEIETGRQVLKLTISAGLAVVHPKEKFDSFFKNADNALYKAKNSGRDRYWIAADE